MVRMDHRDLVEVIREEFERHTLRQLHWVRSSTSPDFETLCRHPMWDVRCRKKSLQPPMISIGRQTHAICPMAYLGFWRSCGASWGDVPTPFSWCWVSAVRIALLPKDQGHVFCFKSVLQFLFIPRNLGPIPGMEWNWPISTTPGMNIPGYSRNITWFFLARSDWSKFCQAF